MLTAEESTMPHTTRKSRPKFKKLPTNSCLERRITLEKLTVCVKFVKSLLKSGTSIDDTSKMLKPLRDSWSRIQVLSKIL